MTRTLLLLACAIDRIPENEGLHLFDHHRVFRLPVHPRVSERACIHTRVHTRAQEDGGRQSCHQGTDQKPSGLKMSRQPSLFMIYAYSIRLMHEQWGEGCALGAHNAIYVLKHTSLENCHVYRKGVDINQG